jgi:hypothetical protein
MLKTKIKPPIRYGRLEKRVKNVIYYHQSLWDSPSYLNRIDCMDSPHDNNQKGGNSTGDSM